MASRWRSLKRVFLVRKYLKYAFGFSMLRISSFSLIKYLAVLDYDHAIGREQLTQGP